MYYLKWLKTYFCSILYCFLKNNSLWSISITYKCIIYFPLNITLTKGFKIVIKLLGVNRYEFQFWFYLTLLRNLETPELPVYSVHGHKEIINTIDGVGGLGIGEGAPEIVTGSRDGKNLLLIYLLSFKNIVTETPSIVQ